MMDEIKSPEITPEERIGLREMIATEGWQVVRKMVGEFRTAAMESLLIASDVSELRHRQGVAYGLTALIDLIEQSSRPPVQAFDYADVTEFDLRARK